MERCLETFNKQRAHNNEAPVDYNHSVIYGMKGKTTWRIDAKILVICNFCGLHMHLKGLLIEMIELWRMCSPDAAAKLDIWAYGVVTQYNQQMGNKSTWLLL